MSSSVNNDITGTPDSSIKVITKTPDVPHTGDTVLTTLATETIKGGSLGASGTLRVTMHWEVTNSANTKTLRCDFGANIIWIATKTAVKSVLMQKAMYNMSATSQEWLSHATLFLGDTGGGTVAGTVDTTVDVDVTFKCQLANSGESITLLQYTIEIMK